MLIRSLLKGLSFRCKICLCQVTIRQYFTVIAACVYLAGCVGATVEIPDTETGVPLTPQEEADDQTTRVWCGVTLWAVIVPIPLKLPVCKLHKNQILTSPFYACGPLMFLAPISHNYEGNMLCGKFH